MPWIVNDVMSQRQEFVALVRSGAFHFKDLCKRFHVCRTTGYKWVARAQREFSDEVFKDKTRRPNVSPKKTSSEIEEAFVGLRTKYPYWGAKKLMVLFKEENVSVKFPCERTVNRILRRRGLLNEESPKGTPFKRFEYDNPNDLWQMDYKGHFRMSTNAFCYPLTVLDDHSRFNLVLDAHQRPAMEKVKASLAKAFQENGLPLKMLMDHGTLWYGNNESSRHPWTRLTVWLMRLGVKILYARIRHPQTCGKDERFHRTLQYDLIDRNDWGSFVQAQRAFDEFRHEYNHVRPHEALNLKRPFERYVQSPRVYPGKLEPITYPEGSLVKKVSRDGRIYHRNVEWLIHKALEGEYVRLMDENDGFMEVYYVNTLVRVLNLKKGTYE